MISCAGRQEERARQAAVSEPEVGQITIAAAIPVIAAAGASATLAGRSARSSSCWRACSSSFQFQENWIPYRATTEGLKYEQFVLLAQAGPYADHGRHYEFIRRVLATHRGGEGTLRGSRAEWEER